MTQPIIVLGAGLAGWTTIRELRKLDSATPILLVAADGADLYSKPILSNALAQQRSPAQLLTTPAAQMAETLQVTLLAHTHAEALDVQARCLRVRGADGSRRELAYHQLVLATGAQPVRVPLQGDAADQVLSVNTLDDYTVFRARLDGGAKTVVIMGAGLIGCEFANDLLIAGHRVHVVDPSLRPLAALLPEAAALEMQRALSALGAMWHLGTTVQAINAAPGRDDQAGTGRLVAQLMNGSRLAADLVLSAIGVRPDTELAAAAGLACDRGIVVDTLLQTSSAGVYALGDCAQYLSAGQRVLPFVMPIMSAAKALAATLAGQPSELVFPLMPISIKTPALPVVVAAPHPALAGCWHMAAGAGGEVWQFRDEAGAQRGFALTGKGTSQRMVQSKATLPSQQQGNSK